MTEVLSRERKIINNPTNLIQKLNQHQISKIHTSERLKNAERKTTSNLEDIHNFEDNTGSFHLRSVKYNEVKSALMKARNDCSTGSDLLPINLLKPVQKEIYVAVNFYHQWVQARISPILKISNPMTPSN